MTVFEECSVVLDLKNVPYKEKRRLTSAILDNGGNISYVVNQKCSFVVACSLETLSCSRQRNAQKHNIPVVGLQYVWRSLEHGSLLPVNEHILQPQASDFSVEPFPRSGWKVSNVQPEFQKKKDDMELGKFRLYEGKEQGMPEFPSNFQVAKYSIFVKPPFNTWAVVELQSARGEGGQRYRIIRSVTCELTLVQDKEVHSCGSEDALEVYVQFSTELEAQSFVHTDTLPADVMAQTSHSLQQLLLEEGLSSSTLSQNVGVFLELIWTEALGSLSSLLTVPVTSISLNDVSRVEGLLLQVQKSVTEDEVQSLLLEVNTLLPLRVPEPDSKAKLVSQRLDLCQLIRDILNVTEATLGNPSPTSLGKYRALRCNIELVPSESREFQTVCKLLQDRPIQIQQVLRVNRASELHLFREELGNIKPLLHSTAPSNLVGILSRGLLLPKAGVEQHGIERTDMGNLGSGIYFSDSLSTSVKYSRASVADGSRLLLVCDVSLGQCEDVYQKKPSLSRAPDGYSSVHAVRRTPSRHSDFEDDEYVVYNTDQIRLKYVVQYFLKEDQVKTFEPIVDSSMECLPSITTSDLLSADDTEGLEETKNPLEDVTPGLLDSNGSTLPLEAVHVRSKLMDLLCQVIILQVYKNKSEVPIEAKYVFPLEETAAVCGFEAFINGKHVIGKVKEKEQARREYKEAIEEGHGAYLMDQEAPDVFTISVGNLPAGATVLIKVTYITELVVRAGTLLFSLPTSVAPWQQTAALNQRTQASVEKVGVKELQPEGEFSLHMSIEMPYEVTSLECSHRIKTKKTECKAVLVTLPDQSLGADGFQLSFSLSQIHTPRMWVEKHPEKDSEACMLVFYPDFECSGVRGSGVSDVVIMLDTSESMRGESLVSARRLALKTLCSLDRSLRVNIISFGSDYKEAFPSPRKLQEAFEPAKKFIMSSSAVGGSTELWRPLRSLNLLPGSSGWRNVLLLSDGHVQNQPQTLQLVRENSSHTRLFTCGLSPTANRYMLRVLAQAGGGVYEFFDTKKKHTWAEKVNSQVRCMTSPGCRSVSVKWQRFNPTAPPPVQAPSQLHALFSDCHTLVYGFVPHCTQATLFGDLSGQEIQTMVSTTELQKTKGTFLHKLTARAVIRDYEDGTLGCSETEHEGQKAALKSYIIQLSKEFSVLSQFTSFVAIEERDQEQPESGFTSIHDVISEENVDILPYMGWPEEGETSHLYSFNVDMDFAEEQYEEASSYSMDMEEDVGLFDCSLRRESALCLLPSPPGAAFFSGGAQNSADVPPPFSFGAALLGSARHRRQLVSALQPPHGAGSSAPALARASSPPYFAHSPYSQADSQALYVSHYRAPPMPQAAPAALLTSLSAPETIVGAPETTMGAPKTIRRSLKVMRETSFAASRIADYTPPPPPPPVLPIAPQATLTAPQAKPSGAFGHGFSGVCERATPAEHSSLETLRASALLDTPFVETSQEIGRLRHRRAFGERRCRRFEARASGICEEIEEDDTQRHVVKHYVDLGYRPQERDFCVMRKKRQPDGINWTALFDLQHQDGYWECTGRLSRFLGLDVDFFTNVFLKEKGICSLGERVRTAILRLLATLLVLQLMRVKKMSGVEFLHSLLQLSEAPEPRPACWEALERAVKWARRTDTQHPCVCSRLELGWDWESCTRQLLGLDLPHPHSTLLPVLQKSVGLATV